MLTPMLTAQSVAVADESGIQHPPVPRLAPSLPAQLSSTRQSEGSSFVGDAQGLTKPKPYRFRSVDYPVQAHQVRKFMTSTAKLPWVTPLKAATREALAAGAFR
jgi:hypothetical protein